MDDILIVGCGYVGRKVACLEIKNGNKVTGLVRSESSVAQLAAAGIASLTADLDDPHSLDSSIFNFNLIYYFVPPGADDEGDRRIANYLLALSNGVLPGRIVLISTTGVYGDCGGAWIDEKTPVGPMVDRSIKRLRVENVLNEWADTHKVDLVILRVPGIYGPGKLPEQRLRKGTPVLREEDSPYSNRIHVDDLVRACVAAARYEKGSAVFNISDGSPSTMTDYFFQVADVLGIPRPPVLTIEQAQSRLSKGMLSYLAESKRMDNKKMREELGVVPEYPDLESGLRACVKK